MSTTTRALVATVAAAVAVATLAPQSASATDADFTIINPYASVDWGTMSQYKSALHNHSTESDGGNTPAERLEDAYAKGFDVYVMTDHNFTSTTWDRTDRPEKNKDDEPLTYLTAERRQELLTGVGRDGRGMLEVPFSNEQSRAPHINTFWADFNNERGATMDSTLAKAEELGGISHINHPGRYTGGSGKIGPDGRLASSRPATIQRYVDLFTTYKSCVGMEIINKKDGDSASDRILWDNILTQMMPERPVWGFSNDDAHSVGALGFSYNWHLMPENTQAALRASMETGTLYASAKISKRELGKDFVSEGDTPTISNIVVDQDANSISIEGKDFEKVEWIANGKKFAEGSSVDLNDHESVVRNYVRAQLIGKGGITFTQPFGITGSVAKPLPTVGGVTLSADATEITSTDDSIQLSAQVKDSDGNSVDPADAMVMFRSDADGLVKIGPDGKLTVPAMPIGDVDVKVTATAIIGMSEAASEPVTIRIVTGHDGNYVRTAVATGNDDVEENAADGSMYLDSSDLEIVYDKAKKQVVGVRFAEVNIPQNATIEQAFIQFTVDEPKKGRDPFAVTIDADASDSAAAFTYDKYSVSSRARTQAKVEWKDIPLWTKDHEAGPDQRTPDLSGIVGELVARDGWKSGNAMAFIIDGEGNRSADSFESNAAPVLHVVYTMPEEPVDPSVRTRILRGHTCHSWSVAGYDTREGDVLRITVTSDGKKTTIEEPATHGQWVTRWDRGWTHVDAVIVRHGKELDTTAISFDKCGCGAPAAAVSCQR